MFFYFNTLHFLTIYFLQGLYLRPSWSEFNGSASFMPSYMSTPSPSGDSSFEENQPLEQRERVSFFYLNKHWGDPQSSSPS
jgi:hypothetical protein